MENRRLKILALPGSLRASSSSNIVMRSIAEMFRANIDLHFFEGIGSLPHFDDPDIVPTIVVDFKNQIKHADAILICTPEYAFGVPGSLKNALDWTVGTGELVNKPVALITASSSGEKGHAAMLLILSALSAKMENDATVLISFIRAKVKDGLLSDIATINQLQTLANKLTSMILY